MKSVKLYGLLTAHVSVLNNLAHRLMNEDVTTEEIIASVRAETQKISEELNK